MMTNNAMVQAFEDLIGPQNVRSDEPALHQYAVDGKKPAAVVFPASVDEVSEVVRLAGKRGLSIVPWGGGSKIHTGYPPSGLDLVVCTERLNRIIEMDTANLTVTVQAGVRIREVQASLAGEENRCYIPYETPLSLSGEPLCSGRTHKGCFIPLSPPYSKKATLGGILASNSTGPTRLLYGTPRDLVTGVRYIAANGQIIGMGGKTVKNVSGYDLSKLMVGSRGSLGILCDMTLRLLPLPERQRTLVFRFPNLKEACRLVDRIFEAPLLPAAVELLDRGAYDLLPLKKAGLSERRLFGVVVSLEGVEEAEDRMGSEIKKMAMEGGGASSADLRGDEHRDFWDSCSNITGEVSERYPELISVKLNYPISEYRGMVEYVESAIPCDHAVFSQAGSGVTSIHCLPSATSGKMVSAFLNNLLERCSSVGGNMVIERVKPELKSELPVWGAGRDDIRVMKWLKERLDPDRIFSPGRFVSGI
jgi:glycolate oxidase FAD binding subunit